MDNTTIILFDILMIFAGAKIMGEVFARLKQPAVIVTMLSISWGAVASVFLAPFMYGLMWKKATKLSAIVSSFAGLGTILILYSVIQGAQWVPLISSIGMLLSLVVLPLVVAVKRRFKTIG